MIGEDEIVIIPESFSCRTFTCIAVSTRGRPASIGGGRTTSPVLRYTLRNRLSERSLIPVISRISASDIPSRDIDRADFFSSVEMCRRTIVDGRGYVKGRWWEAKEDVGVPGYLARNPPLPPILCPVHTRTNHAAVIFPR